MNPRHSPMAVVAEALSKALAQINLAQVAAERCDPEMATALSQAAVVLVEQHKRARAILRAAQPNDRLASPVRSRACGRWRRA